MTERVQQEREARARLKREKEEVSVTSSVIVFGWKG